MSVRRPLSLAITLAVVMIVLLLALTVGWVLLAVFGALEDTSSAPIYWALLTVGTAAYVALVVGVVIYLVLSIKAINLTRRQSNFVDSVTHELKSPIASLKLALQTLNRRNLSPEQQADFHRFMLDDVERLDRLINQVLEAGRLEAGVSDGELSDVPLEPVLRQCAEMVCMQYRVPVETVLLETTPCVVRGRTRELDLLFRNLIDNAVKYSGRPPEVRVTSRKTPEGAVIVQVSDNGRGIPTRLRRAIFGRFVRVGSELERDRPGTGLGLFIVRETVRRLGGSIRVVDGPEGAGAVFEVKLHGSVAASKDERTV